MHFIRRIMVVFLHSNPTLPRISLHKVRQLYNNISVLFLFPVRDGKLSTGVNDI